MHKYLVICVCVCVCEFLSRRRPARVVVGVYYRYFFLYVRAAVTRRRRRCRRACADRLRFVWRKEKPEDRTRREIVYFYLFFIFIHAMVAADDAAVGWKSHNDG